MKLFLELAARSAEEAQQTLARRGLERTWFFEKRRTEYRWKKTGNVVVLDKVPELGHFLEIEGQVSAIRTIAAELDAALEDKESQNYSEIFIAYRVSRGVAKESVLGAEFRPLEV